MGSLSDYGLGPGTSVALAARLSEIPTAGLRAGDLAYMDADGVNVSPWWAFDPASVLAVGGDTVYADVARATPGLPGRWRRTNITWV